MAASSAAPAGQKAKAAAAALASASPEDLPEATDEKNNNIYQYNRPGIPLRIKAKLKDDIRIVEIPRGAGYEELKLSIRQKFPEAGPLVMKYKDEGGDEITINARQDVAMAIASVAAYIDELDESELPAKEEDRGPKLPKKNTPNETKSASEYKMPVAIYLYDVKRELPESGLL